MKEKTFIRITNKNIYDKLESIEKHVIETNGKVKLNRWISSTALGALFVLVCYLLKINIGG